MVHFRFVMAISALFYGGLVPAGNAQIQPSAAQIAGYSGLHLAAHRGDLAEIIRLAAAGADLDTRDPNGRTSAHVAAFASQDRALAELAAAGADQSIGDYGGVTSLKHAQARGYSDMVDVIRAGG